MVVLSLFDGMSCGQIALRELGVTIDTYYASEVEKYPIQCTQHNFPNTIQLGDVRHVDVSLLKHIDLLIGGSPCQSFSFAGKRKGMATKCNEEIYTLDKYLELKNEGFEFEGQSYLFWEYMRILEDIRKYNPDVKFLLENVEMGKKWERVLSEAIGVYGVHINSALVSAQNRKRIYWTNIRTRKEGLFGDLYADIPQPKDEGILLKYILESDVDEKYYLSEKMLKYFETRAANFNNGKVNVRQLDDKTTTITASMASCDISDNFVAIDADGNIGNHKSGAVLSRYHKGASNLIDTRLSPKENQDKANCFTAGGNSGGLHSDMDLIVHNLLPRSSTSGKGGNGPLSRNDGKTYCLSTNDMNAVERQNRIRRLTPLEVQRLQTIPAWYDMSVLSDTQIYKACGNGWTIKVIMHILSYLPNLTTKTTQQLNNNICPVNI